MTPLEKLRSELSKEHFDKCKPWDDHFAAGFNAAITALEREAGEFDQREAENAEMHISGETQRAIIFGMGARWQFECDRARIGLAESKYIDVVDRYSKAADKVLDLTARLEQAEHKAQVWEGSAYAVDQRCLEQENTITHLEGKLAAAQARIKELEAKLDRYENDSRQFDEIDKLQAKCAELTAQIKLFDEQICICGEINSRHCPIHNEERK